MIPVTDVDRQFYAERLQSFLPDRLIDIHTHVWRSSDFKVPKASAGGGRTVTWPARVASENPIEDLLETYRLLLPGKQVTPLIFATLPTGGNLDAQNAYIAQSARRENVPSLVFSDPTWSAAELAQQVRAGGHVGAKSYLSLAPDYLPGDEIRIFDFFPPHHLEVHDQNGWIVMLHIPRPGRLRDPVNLAQLLQIERDYPNLSLIVAHVGRAYCEEDIGDAFDCLAATERLCFDISANTNAEVFERAIGCVGPRRLLFGTDLPILRMRMRRICEQGRYVNIVPRGLYGDVSADPNMRETDGADAASLTFFLYEEIDAFRRASEAAGLSAADVDDVFCGNALRLLTRAGAPMAR